MSSLVNDTIRILAEKFPTTFSIYERKRKPLKLRIDTDILAANVGISPLVLSLALSRYTKNEVYLAHCYFGNERVDLAGQAVGTVTEAEAKFARAELGRLRAKREKYVAARKESAPKPKSLPEALASLREAAKARKAAASARLEEAL